MNNITKISIKVGLIVLTTATLAVAGSDAPWTEYQLASPRAETRAILGIKTRAKELQGVWWSETDPRSYIEFKGNQYCPNGSFGREVGPYKFPEPCPQYFTMRVVGDTIMISAEGTTARLKWKITKGKLRLFVPGVPGSQLILVKNKLPKKQAISQKPTPLEGVWKEETSGYMWQFKGNQFCVFSDFDERGLPQLCGGRTVFQLFTLNGTAITVTLASNGETVNSGTWRLTDDELEVVWRVTGGEEMYINVLHRLPSLSKSAQAMQGVWRLAESLVLDPDTEQWRAESVSERKGGSEGSDYYLIVQGYKICLLAELIESEFHCDGGYEWYRMEGSKIFTGQPGYDGEGAVSLRDGRLEYVTSLKGTLKQIYVKTTLTPPPLIFFSG